MRRPTVAILHYSCPPVLGGVELVMEAHARMFAEAGFPTKVIVGEGGKLHPKVKTVIVPELVSRGGPQGKELEELAACRVPKNFDKAVSVVEKKLARVLKDVDVCMMHNVVTMHFNMILTTALANLMAKKSKTRFIGWIHDATFIDPAYKKFHIHQYPWELMNGPMKGCEYCVISTERQGQLSKLFKLPKSKLPVIPDGVDSEDMLGLSPVIASLFREEKLYDKDIVALTPARLVPRKNIEAGIKVVAALKKAGQSVRWMITGAPDPHNADAYKYYEMLCALRKKLRVEKEVIFLGERVKERISFNDLRGLYSLSDMLIFMSAREGFGIPVLEAGITGVLVLTTNIPVMKELGRCDAVVAKDKEAPAVTAKRVITAMSRSPRLKFRKLIMRGYSWDMVFEKDILPLVLKRQRKTMKKK